MQLSDIYSIVYLLNILLFGLTAYGFVFKIIKKDFRFYRLQVVYLLNVVLQVYFYMGEQGEFHRGLASFLPESILLRNLSQATLGVSLVFVSAALILFLWSSFAVRGQNFSLIYSEDIPESITQTGPYRYVRHPFYTAYLLCFFSAIICTGKIVLLIPYFVLSALYFQAARSEERKILNSKLSSEYRNYMAKSKMFLPFVF